MNYNEWRDELKSNLLCVSESERRRVLDYYAEAYADRREAGFSEREIMDDFGAPYDAAQRILSGNRNYEYSDDSYSGAQQTRREKRREEREKHREEHARRGGAEYSYSPPPPPPPARPAPAAANGAVTTASRSDYTWVFVILCIVFAIPIFGIIMGMIGITIGFCTAPIAVIGTGAAITGGAIGSIVGGEFAYGLCALGGGIIVIGIGVILCPLFFKLVGLMWKLFKMFFSWLKSLFSGKERV